MIRPIISFRAIKIDEKYKHLSNFLAVTLRTLLPFVLPVTNGVVYSLTVAKIVTEQSNVRFSDSLP
jgi:hypothetical protein